MDQLALSIGGTPIPAPIGIPSGGLSIKGEEILSTTINLFLIVAVVLAVVFLLLGGIRWITSAGDQKGIESARKQITYAIVGLIIVVAAFLIVNLIGEFLNTTKLIR